MSKATDLLCAIALKEVGATTGAKYNTWYWGSNNGAAWCAAFASWCLDQAGYGSIGGKFASCTAWRNWLQSKKIWFLKGKTDPQPGDLVFYNWSVTNPTDATVCEHVGIVIAYDTAKKQLTTVEGNTSGASQGNGNQCQLKYRALNYVVGYGRPPYPTDSTVGGNPYAVPTRTLQKGDSGNDVRWVQTQLNRCAVIGISDITVDGSFGPVSDYAVKALQNAVGLAIDGVVGPATRRILATAGSGDVNGDGKVDTTDARLVMQYTVGKITLTNAQKIAADVNGDGKIDTIDSRLILQATVGKATI